MMGLIIYFSIGAAFLVLPARFGSDFLFSPEDVDVICDDPLVGAGLFSDPPSLAVLRDRGNAKEAVYAVIAEKGGRR